MTKHAAPIGTPQTTLIHKYKEHEVRIGVDTYRWCVFCGRRKAHPNHVGYDDKTA